MIDLLAKCGLAPMSRAVWLGAAALLLVLILSISQCRSARQDAARSRLNANQAEAVAESAQDAIAATGAVSANERATDDLTRSNADEIRNAAGADAPVNPAVRDAGLDSLCRRAAYRGRAECVQRAASR